MAALLFVDISMHRFFFLSIFSLIFLPLFSHSLTHYVDPRIGSEEQGRVFIGPSAPFGMVKPGPDAVSMPNAGWALIPEAVKGFSQTHVSGTGGGQKYGNVLIQPILKTDKPSRQGVLMPDGSVLQVPVFEQMRRKEKIALGYYACTYYNNIETEITTAPRCAFYRFRHAGCTERRLQRAHAGREQCGGRHRRGFRPGIERHRL